MIYNLLLICASFFSFLWPFTTDIVYTEDCQACHATGSAAPGGMQVRSLIQIPLPEQPASDEETLASLVENSFREEITDAKCTKCQNPVRKIRATRILNPQQALVISLGRLIEDSRHFYPDGRRRMEPTHVRRRIAISDRLFLPGAAEGEQFYLK